MRLSSAMPSVKDMQTLNSQQWLALGSKYAPLAVCVLATLGIAWQASKLTWLLVAKPTAEVSSPIPVSRSPAPASSQVDVQTIVGAHLFGSPIAVNPDAATLPRSQTNLVLAGTVALEDPKAGYAIVGENAANAKFYKVGAVVGGASLHSVYPDRVVLDSSGTLEALPLPRSMASTATVNARPTPAPAPNRVGDNLRRLAESNPTAIAEMLRAQPVFSGGTQKGYRVYPGRDREQFTRLGLQPGDLITSVNGAPLDDPSRSAEILNTLNSSTAVTVTVERGGSTRQLTLDPSQISIPEPESGPTPAGTNPGDATNPSPSPGGGPPTRAGAQ